MFEKSLYDLIRGLRNHKGSEREYIRNSLAECRWEIKSQDMDTKATAVLKLTYLEMFGHDMSWAAFNVLEVMSSPKYLQKRVGYLGAIQSFRPDTEVLMLAENLLKKDLNSPQLPTISLPLIAIPHVISPSMANSLLSDILPRLTHTNPSIRKKTIVTLYRLALVYPETLRPAWPKIKERLTDDNEDPSVTAAIVNVVCELGWRRPQDFLPLAPRLFDLLVDGSNNWMAIKIIKLFATLTPLEPRLVKKLLPPLTSIIKSTPAMSLLYECINGIIQGGILESAQGTTEGDEVARLCVSKLRGMLTIEGDPNLKYVALLAFNKIVESHPYLVSFHEDVIIDCIDDPDISIRLRALDLVVGMVNAQNLTSLVERLLQQLRNSPLPSLAHEPGNDRAQNLPVEPSADMDEEEAKQSIKQAEHKSNRIPPLPDEHRVNVIKRIMEMCSRNTYEHISDFDWYLDVLVQLVKHVPSRTVTSSEVNGGDSGPTETEQQSSDVAFNIGCEIRNVAIRVKSSRQEAIQAAETLVSLDRRAELFPSSGNGGQGVLAPCVWAAGEFPHLLSNPYGVLDSMVNSNTLHASAITVSAYIQAIAKIYSFLAGQSQEPWTAERKSQIALLSAKVIYFLESLISHPNLETQERAVEYLELIRLASEAASVHSTESSFIGGVEPPLLLTEAIPALFSGMELNPVSRDAQRKVPIPDELNLDQAINENLTQLLQVPEHGISAIEDDEFHAYYYVKPPVKVAAEPAANRLQAPEPEISYQQSNGNYLDPDIQTRLRTERRDKNKDDPFYIASEDNSGISTPANGLLKTNNGEELDVDSIPIMELDLGNADEGIPKPPIGTRAGSSYFSQSKRSNKPRNFEILGDESIGDSAEASGTDAASQRSATGASKRSLLQVDSSGLGSFSLETGEGTSRKTQLDLERREAEEAEMAQAMKEVERLRLEMQRASERIEAKYGPSEGIVIKKKKKKRKGVVPEEPVEGGSQQEGEQDTALGEEEPVMAEKKKKKKKKRQQVTFPEEDSGVAAPET